LFSVYGLGWNVPVPKANTITSIAIAPVINLPFIVPKNLRTLDIICLSVVNYTLHCILSVTKCQAFFIQN